MHPASGIKGDIPLWGSRGAASNSWPAPSLTSSGCFLVFLFSLSVLVCPLPAVPSSEIKVVYNKESLAQVRRGRALGQRAAHSDATIVYL